MLAIPFRQNCLDKMLSHEAPMACWFETEIPMDEACRNHLAVATPADSRPCPRQFHLLIQDEGTVRVRQGNWVATIGPGDIALCAGISPLEMEENAHKHLMFCAPFQSEVPLGLARYLPAVLPANHAAARVLRQMAELLEFTSAELGGRIAGHLVGGLLSLFAAALEKQTAMPPPVLSHLARFHLARIKDYLRQHARDPGLSVADVARALDLSVSHVHRIFAWEGSTVAKWLWAQRLQSCAAELSDPAHAHRTVGEIALDWGFSDLSHFSRSFRKRFGISPKEWRNRSGCRFASGGSGQFTATQPPDEKPCSF